MTRSSSVRLKSVSAAQTKRYGRKLGALLCAGDVVALSGPLGAGKTTFTKGLSVGLGVADESDVASPTFVLVHEYAGREKIYHLDWYRLDRMGELDERLASECFGPGGIAIVEWPEKGAGSLPNEHLRVEFKHLGGACRSIRVIPKGARYRAIARALAAEL